VIIAPKPLIPPKTQRPGVGERIGVKLVTNRAHDDRGHFPFVAKVIKEVLTTRLILPNIIVDILTGVIRKRRGKTLIPTQRFVGHGRAE